MTGASRVGRLQRMCRAHLRQSFIQYSPSFVSARRSHPALLTGTASTLPLALPCDTRAKLRLQPLSLRTPDIWCSRARFRSLGTVRPLKVSTSIRPRRSPYNIQVLVRVTCYCIRYSEDHTNPNCLRLCAVHDRFCVCDLRPHTLLNRRHGVPSHPVLRVGCGARRPPLPRAQSLVPSRG
jgi:hypothetical protein